MAVFDLYSKRRKQLIQGTIDVFQYDTFPNKFKVQVVQILKEAIGNGRSVYSQSNSVWASIHEILAREYGKFRLGGERESDFSCAANYFLRSDNPDEALDFIELAFWHVVKACGGSEYRERSQPQITPASAVEELNERFLESDLGYEFVSEKVIRKDNELIHKEIILPALTLLYEAEFAGANAEYLAAHEHYRNGRSKECINDCLKAFESTMKTICKRKKWKFGDRDTAKTLIEVCFSNNLIPDFLQSEIAALRSSLESGIPTVRNRLSGHGQGSVPIEVPSYYASYLLQLTAATILLLSKAAESK